MVNLKKYRLALILLAAFILIPLTIGNTTDVHNVIIYILIYAMVGEAWNLITGFTGQTICADPENHFGAVVLSSRTGGHDEAIRGRARIIEKLFSEQP